MDELFFFSWHYLKRVGGYGFHLFSLLWERQEFTYDFFSVFPFRETGAILGIPQRFRAFPLWGSKMETMDRAAIC